MIYRPTKSWLITFENISPLVPAALSLDRCKAGFVAIRSANNFKLLGNKARGVMTEYTVATEVSWKNQVPMGYPSLAITPRSATVEYIPVMEKGSCEATAAR
jgi:hypothetical protein